MSGPRARSILIRLVFSSSYCSTMQLGVPPTSGSWTGTGLGIGQQSLCLTLILIPDLGNIFEPMRYSYSDSLMGLWISDLPTWIVWQKSLFPFVALKIGSVQASQPSLVMAFMDFVPLALVYFFFPALTGEYFCPVTQRVFALTSNMFICTLYSFF